MVLVLGGAGYIGSHMAKLLRNRGIPHIVGDNLSRGHREAVKDSAFAEIELRDTDALTEIMQSRGITLVILFAGKTSVGESMRSPADYFENNVGGSSSLLKAMDVSGVRNIIFSSSAAVYGEPSSIPIEENHPANPTNVYGETKLMTERMLNWYSRTKGFKAVCLRYFNAAGADPEGEIGEDHSPEEHLIPAAIEAAMGKREKLTIFGDDYDTVDGTCVRDYVHVWDLADAHALALNSFEFIADGGFSVYNLGSGDGYTVKQVMQTVAEVSGKEVPHIIGGRRPGDPAKLVASSGRIIDELGWSPVFGNLKTIVEHAWKWHTSHPNGYGGSS
jgi:UDP-glucose 4-epimerase